MKSRVVLILKLYVEKRKKQAFFSLAEMNSPIQLHSKIRKDSIAKMYSGTDAMLMAVVTAAARDANS